MYGGGVLRAIIHHICAHEVSHTIMVIIEETYNEAIYASVNQSLLSVAY